MQTIKLELEDAIYDNIQAKGINIKELFEGLWGQVITIYFLVPPRERWNQVRI